MSVQRPMKPLEKVERDAHEMATTCRICKSPFTETNPKYHHHNHVSGDYLFAASENGGKSFFGEYLLKAQGEDVVAGIRTPEPLAAH